ncbi:MAG: hypothetical protein PHF97_11840 [Bacteroidales bacterium]|nr:hypothetical protein [Bacteroidales bacterium]
MSPATSVFLFPAFINSYSENPGLTLPGFSELFDRYIQQAADSIEPKLALFDFHSSNFLEDELLTQYITFLYSCAASTILRNNSVHPRFTTGYSMGIYAAFFDGGSVSLETGLMLIRSAYQSLISSLDNEIYGMGAIIGLSRSDILNIIDSRCLNVEITNQNASHSFVISGLRNNIETLLFYAHNEGALHTRCFNVSIPYHHSLLGKGAKQFEESISHLEIFPSHNPVISLIDQKQCNTAWELRQEVVRNLFNPLNWLKTNEWLIKNGTTEIIECGPSKNLAKNAKFLPGNYRFYTLDKISSQIKSNPCG